MSGREAALLRAVVAVRELHYPTRAVVLGVDVCAHCSVLSEGFATWPCLTRRAVDEAVGDV